ncbi:MAG: type II toxin-antitoxin system mRNA interferase toxin, RelE/StbE family [Candidatus Omnitrophota bacterium]|nr:MAG: type II toxin-antitoxin system mRNA interferase toxin, RelE/StbE family [Candidatus Omnitrophota bacterium]
MKFIYRKSFTKSLQKLPPNQQKRIGQVIRCFENNPFDPQLKNHSLHGEQKELRAISAGGDLRIIFMEENNYEVIHLIRIGTHNQVY